ncbi:MAG: hypothetical protein LUP99_00270 [Methanomicrobiales archaeon]|nr:hypothetical protein [Methanomicrobiales archaeon]
MTTLRFLLHHLVKAKRIKLAVGAICEVCGYAGALEDLEVHSFLEDAEDRYSPAELEPFLLILCTWCHRALHTCGISVWEQEALVQERPEPIREEIRAILAYIHKPYMPPEIDMEDAYREASAPHHYRYGG